MPGALNFYWTTSTPNDNLISGPSGYGYTYPNLWTDAAQLDQFVAKTEQYNERAGFRVTTVWNTITGGINQNVGDSYATNAPSLLGVTAQNTGGGLTIYKNALPGMALACNYCTGEQAMKDFIASASQGWSGGAPRFEIIQAQPWQDVTPTSFLNVASSLSSDYVVVRPDIIFQLIREANGLATNPIVTYSIAASADPHGTISPSGTVTVNQNEAQTFTFTPSAGYSVNAVTVDGVGAPAAPSYAFINVTANHTISVAFTDGSGDAGAPDAASPEAGLSDSGLPDAGPHPIDAAAPDAAGGDAGVGPGDQPGGPGSGGGSNGCGCRVPGGSASAPPTLAVLGLLVLVRRRRARPDPAHES
jgi:MYXO-CTERM domain-containing protein